VNATGANHSVLYHTNLTDLKIIHENIIHIDDDICTLHLIMKNKDYDPMPERDDDEEFVNAITHSFAFGSAILVVIIGLFIVSYKLLFLFYSLTMLTTLFASIAYHASRNITVKLRMRSFDQAVIYWLIGATWTVFLLPIASYVLLAVMWLLIIIFSYLRVKKHYAVTRYATLSYCVVAALGLLRAVAIWTLLSKLASILFVLGLISFAFGVYYYVHDYNRWYHTIWHLLVMFGLTSHFFAILLILL
jgi:hemolysin III